MSLGASLVTIWNSAESDSLLAIDKIVPTFQGFVSAFGGAFGSAAAMKADLDPFITLVVGSAVSGLSPAMGAAISGVIVAGVNEAIDAFPFPVSVAAVAVTK